MMIDEAIFDSTIGDITLDQVEFSKANKNSSNVYTLYQNRPNPTKGETTIDFDLPVAGNVIITLKNAIGQVEYTHIKNYSAGHHSHRLNIANFSKGVYIYSILVNGHQQSKKLLLTE